MISSRNCLRNRCPDVLFFFGGSWIPCADAYRQTHDTPHLSAWATEEKHNTFEVSQEVKFIASSVKLNCFAQFLILAQSRTHTVPSTRGRQTNPSVHTPWVRDQRSGLGPDLGLRQSPTLTDSNLLCFQVLRGSLSQAPMIRKRSRLHLTVSMFPEYGLRDFLEHPISNNFE